jgi:large conductance mechanosensitive channel
MSFVKDFKAFLMRGNVIDLALAVIIGGAFSPIVNSMVADIIMPPIGMVLGGVNFTDLKLVLQAAEGDAPEVAISYGKLIQAIINFIVIAFCIFVIMRAYDKVRKQEEAAPAAPPAPTNEEVLLAEIRDLLKK